MIEIVRILRQPTDDHWPRFPISDSRYELESCDVGSLSVHGDLAIKDYPSGVWRQSLCICDLPIGLDWRLHYHESQHERERGQHRPLDRAGSARR